MSDTEIIDAWHKLNCFDCGGNCILLSLTFADEVELIEILRDLDA